MCLSTLRYHFQEVSKCILSRGMSRSKIPNVYVEGIWEQNLIDEHFTFS